MRRLLLAVGLVAGCQRAPVAADLLLVTFDTTRADALGAYGASPSPSPTIDRLAAEGLRVAEAMTVVPLTLPAHSSMLTGLYPDLHGVRDNGQFVHDEVELVPHRLADAGYRTGGFVSAVVLDGTYGLERGFEHYEDGFDLTTPGRPGDPILQWSADHVVDSALAWLGRQPSEDPVFLWVHFYDPHLPLRPPQAFATAFDDPYAAEIAFADSQLDRLLQRVEARGRPVAGIVVGDHGEGHGDHGEPTHGLLVYRSTMRVPFVVWGAEARGVVDEPLSVVDVAPTLLELGGVEVPADLDGRSVLAVAEGRAAPRGWVYGESQHPRTHFGLADLRVMQSAKERFIEAPMPEHYAWRTDPGELVNTADAETTRRWRERLANFDRARADRVREPLAGDPGLRGALAALGYLDGGGPRDRSGLPDPKSAPDLASRVERQIIAARLRPPGEAVPMLSAFLQEFPGVTSVRFLLATALELDGRPADAREVLSVLVANRPEDPVLQCRLAELHMVEGHFAEAERLATAVREAHPTYPVPIAILAEVARRDGRCERAEELIAEGIRLDAQSTRLRLVRGACLLERGAPGLAEVELRAVLSQEPRNVDAPYLLAMSLARQERHAEAIPYFEQQLEITPDRTLARAGLGLALYATGAYERSVVVLDPIGEHPQVGSEVPLLLADALLRTSADGPRVDRLLALSEERDGSDPRLPRIRAAVFVGRGAVERALELTVPDQGGRQEFGVPR